MPGILYLVATPIGNLKDISIRAVDVLSAVDLIACEDTRHTGKLLREFSIETPLLSYHEHNEEERAEEIAGLIRKGKNVAIVSDAGSPAIADPGYRAVKAAVDAGASVVPVPGASAVIAGLSVSGLPTDTVLFLGFLPARKGERLRKLREYSEVPATIVFYEAPHRILASLSDCIEILGDRRASVSRELTKLHEETVRGRLSEIQASFSSADPKGEFVVVIDRKTPTSVQNLDEADLAELFDELVEQGVDPKKALKQIAKRAGIPRDEAYRRIHLFGK